MKTFQLIALAALSLFVVSCGNNSKQAEKADERFVEKVDEKTGIASLSPFSGEDSVKVNGKEYYYSFNFHAVDSLPTVVYEATGAEYHDNAVELKIMRGEEVIIEKRFTKASFKSYVPEKLYNTSGLIGFTYNIDRKLEGTDNAFYFIATIGNLDDQEEIAYSLELKIDTSGSMTITKYEALETEPLRKGLTVDPDADGV